MNEIENNLISKLIEKDEKTSPLINVLNESYQEYISQSKTDELQDFMSFCNKLLSISKEQVNKLDLDLLKISKDEALRIAVTKNLYDCLSNSDQTFLEYLDTLEKELVNEYDNEMEK